jgi:hypothetical protein
MNAIARNDNTQSVNIPFALNYSFDYDRFAKPDLQAKAKSTLGSFFGFVRQTFDGLIEIGRSLQDFYFDCLAFCPNGKKVFEEWLSSDDFGASKYIAKSAMEIYAWFEKLPARTQKLIRQNVQNWSVSALRQLTKVSHDLVKELVLSGKKTAAQVKKEFGSARAKEGENLVGSHGEEKVNDMPTSLSLSLSRSQTPISDPCEQQGVSERVVEEGKENNISLLLSASTPELVPGMRIVVKEENTGWNGYSGIIMSKRQDDFWVLLDHTIAQGMEVKHLLKPHQIELETQQPIAKSTSHESFTTAQVEQKVADAIAQYNREKAESEQGRFVEIRDAALQAAKREIQSAQEHAISAISFANTLEQAKQKLIEQLASKDLEMRSLHALQTRNQQLEQRVAELEKALENSSANNWDNTFNNPDFSRYVEKEIQFAT